MLLLSMNTNFFSCVVAPLTLALPAAAAAAAYLNAKAHIWYDLKMLSCVAPMAIQMYWRERAGKLSLFYDLEHWALNPKTADTPFLLFQDRSWTFKEGLDETLRHGAWLRETYGIRKDEIVAMDFVNSDAFVFIWMGLWSIGAKPAFINYNLTGQALVHCARAAGASLMLVDPQVAQNVDDYVRTELAGVKIDFFTAERRREVVATRPTRLPDEERADEGLFTMSNLIYTSGTTGLPKAAVVSWGKVHAAGGFSARLINARPGEIFYTVSRCSSLLYHPGRQRECCSTGMANVGIYVSACPSITPLAQFCASPMPSSRVPQSPSALSFRHAHFGPRFVATMPP